jgi:hypothetical protein
MKAITAPGQITLSKAAMAFLILGLLIPFLVLAAPAQAKLVVGSPQPVIAISADDTAIATGPAGTLIESNYFNAPQAPLGVSRSCRLPMSLFDKTRLARACN